MKISNISLASAGLNNTIANTAPTAAPTDKQPNPDRSKVSDQQAAEAIKLHFKKGKTFADTEKEFSIRKKGPALDRMLYQADVADALGEMGKLFGVLQKVARGEKLSPEEQKMLEKYPDLAKVASQAKDTADQTKQALHKARTPQEKKQILAQAHNAAAMMAGSGQQKNLLPIALLNAALSKIDDSFNAPDLTNLIAAHQKANRNEMNRNPYEKQGMRRTMLDHHV